MGHSVPLTPSPLWEEGVTGLSAMRIWSEVCGREEYSYEWALGHS